MKRLMVIGSLLTALFALPFAANADVKKDIGENYSFITLGAEKLTEQPFTQHQKINSQWLPKIGIGLGHSYQLNQDWQIDHQLVLEYSKGSATLVSSEQDLLSQMPSYAAAPVTSSGQLQTTGLWLKNRLTRENLFANAAPFIELDVGTIHQRFDANNHQVFKDKSSQQLAYKALVGLSFDLTNDVDISIAVGHQNDIN